MILKSHRLFIGNIPAGTSEQELSQEFSAYGNVEAIEIKTKTNPLNDSVDTFGFVTLQTEDHIVPQCIKEFKQQQYKGAYLNVSRAKESFLEKLKREREEAEAQKKNSSSLDPYTKPVEEKVAKEPVASLPTLPTLPTLGKDDDSSCSESSESESEEEKPSSAQTAPARRSQAPKQEDEIVKKWNQETYIEHGKLKIVPITGKVTEVIDRTKPHQKRTEDKKLGEKARIADEKRKQGLNNLKSAYEQQQLAIKSALAGATANNKKKITFDDEDDAPGQKKLSLFDGPEDEDDDGFKANFTLRKQMLGEEGQKLYEMQTTYQADNRFRLDARFDDDAGKSAEVQTPQSKAKDKERKKQLEILSNVVGKPIIAENRVESKNNVQMQRFDPTQQKESDQNETHEPAVKASDRKKAERREEDFKVSEQKFYNVSDSFSLSSRGQSQGFSLLSMFGTANDTSDSKMHVDETLYDKPLKSDAKFRYESSDSEDEQSRKKQKKHETKADGEKEGKGKEKLKKNKAGKTGSGYYTKQGIWKDFFFFLPNDSRLDAGREFLGYVPDTDGSLKSAKEAVVGLTETDVQNIRQLYKKRRQRESKFVHKESKLGLKRLKMKSTVKRGKMNKVK
ncbi:probable RNA-binding protein CG14230 [Anopheles gambiae]|uniref:probable RNA-binding protein CG14230 n=1 Tax=Anopheles gambiae TaxID=7165 RepID=UPI002AC8F0E8|nr:probable RNA-binding protein CG14230 [Anopheles gambiae]